MKLLLIVTQLISSTAYAEVKVNPQFVVNRILSESRQSRTIDLTEQSSEGEYYSNFAQYDWLLTGSSSYEDTKYLYLSGSGNLQDKTAIWSVGMSKRIPTGTTVGVTFSRTLQNSTYRSSSSSSSLSRGSYAVYDVGELTITQDLLGNFFGIAERKIARAAEQNLEVAALTRKESQETLVLDALKLFWDSYVSKESLREAISQRDKYENLVKEVESKSRLGFSNPGDLPKAKASLGAQVRNVKNASFTYLENLDKLVTTMRLPESDKDIKFEVKEELPPLPTMVMPKVSDLRSVVMKEIKYDNAELNKRATDIAADWPDLKLIGVAGSTGLDASASKAFANMISSSNQKYSIELNLTYRFFSNKSRADKSTAGVKYEQAFNDLLKQREEERRVVSTAMEKVRLTYAAAVSAMEETNHWDRAVREQEKTYKQGRVDFSQLIQDYNSYFASRATRIRAIGDYQIALHEYAAAVDILVK